MSRYTLIALASVLMLLVSACGSGGDNGGDDAADQPNQEEQNGTDSASDETPTSESGNGDTGASTTPESGTPEAGAPESGTPEASGTPGADMAQQGIFYDLTFEEANELTPFELRQPEELPEGIEFQSIMAMASPNAPEEQRSEEATTAVMSYLQTTEDENTQGLPVELTQTTEMDMTQGLPQEAKQEEMTIGDRDVTRVTLTQGENNEVVAYMWQDGDVHFSLAAIMGPGLEASDLESMVQSIPTS